MMRRRQGDFDHGSRTNELLIDCRQCRTGRHESRVNRARPGRRVYGFPTCD
jgi:hypothetical protein